MKLLLPIFLSSFLNAKGIDADNLGSIYTEAIIFVAVFAVMSIVSIIISKRNAKKFEVENPLEERKATRREEMLKKELKDIPVVSKNSDLDRLIELSTMLQNNSISQKEFDILKASLNIEQN